MADDKKSVRLEVDEETHTEWMEFVEETADYSTLSGLIRIAVDREMQLAESDGSQRVGEVDIDFSPVEEAIYDLEERVAGVETEMRSLDIAADAKGDEQITEMMHYVRRYIPLVESKDDLADLKTAVVELPKDERAQLSGTVGDVTEALRMEAEKTAEMDEPDDDDFDGTVDAWDVERALERLAREVARVKVIVDEGERRYFEVDNE